MQILDTQDLDNGDVLVVCDFTSEETRLLLQYAFKKLLLDTLKEADNAQEAEARELSGKNPGGTDT